VVQRLDGALQGFAPDGLDDDVAILTLAPGSRERLRPVESDRIERLFDAFNRREREEIVALCDERMEFFAVTAEQAGRYEPYVGSEGLHTYLNDVARLREELLITPREIEQRGDSLLVRGRVYLRSHSLGIRDMPAGWIWDLHEGRFIRGRVFVDPE